MFNLFRVFPGSFQLRLLCCGERRAATSGFVERRAATSRISGRRFPLHTNNQIGTEEEASYAEGRWSPATIDSFSPSLAQTGDADSGHSDEGL